MKLLNPESKVTGVFRSIFRPRPSGPIEDWASENIELSSKESGDFAGPYDPSLNPLPTILFEVYQSGLYRKAIFKKSSQSGLTLAVLILICYYVSYVKRNFLYVIDSLSEMRRVSQERLQPMLRKCKAALAEIPVAEDAMKALTLSLRGCVGYLLGAGSLGALSNKSVGLAVYDEPDAYPPVKEGEETATDLGSERGKKQSTFFEVWLSKPIWWEGPINQAYLPGTRHKCFVPCPHCGTYQELRWTRFRYDHCQNKTSGVWDLERVLRETWYECINEACEIKKIEEHHKPEMVRRREWRQTNFGEDEYGLEPGVFSCELTDLYSTFPTATWGILAREYVESEGKPSLRQKFWRGRVAQATRQKKIKTAEDDIRNLFGDYFRGQCPVQPDVIVMYCDVQGIADDQGNVEMGLKKWVKCGITFHDDACYLIDYGTSLGFPELLVEADKPVQVMSWRDTTPLSDRVDPVVYKGLVDEGFQQKKVREWAASTAMPTRLPNGAPDFRFYTSWGQGGVHSAHMRDVVTPRNGEAPNITVHGMPTYAYRYSDDNFKEELYHRRIGLAREHLRAKIENRTAPAEEAPILRFPKNSTPEFVAEFMNETFEYSRKKGKWMWVKRGPNDFPDGVKGCLVQGYILKPVFQMAGLGGS